MTLGGKLAVPDALICQGQVLHYFMRDYEEPETDTRWFLILEKEGLRFVHKPPKLPIHKTGKILVNTLVNLHRESTENKPWAPLNRLDVETSGIVAFALGAEEFRLAAPASPDAQWTKLYLAWVRSAPEQESGEITWPLKELPGDEIRCRMHPHPEGKASRTQFRVLHRGKAFTLLALRPWSGRKHQLRAHLSALGCPIVGDKIYSLDGQYYLQRLLRELQEADWKVLGSEHHLLHAFRLDIVRIDRSPCRAEDFAFPESFGLEGRTAGEWGEWMQSSEIRNLWEPMLAAS
jgi:23S rRNA pseudouridine1911/1915/1917 synthase